MSAVNTGLLAASAGVFTKAAGDADHLATYACSHHHLLQPVNILCSHFSENVRTVIIQVMLYGLMIGCNVGMFSCFNTTLQRCDTTIVASVTCTAANITFSVSKCIILFSVPIYVEDLYAKLFLENPYFMLARK